MFRLFFSFQWRLREMCCTGERPKRLLLSPLYNDALGTCCGERGRRRDMWRAARAGATCSAPKVAWEASWLFPRSLKFANHLKPRNRCALVCVCVRAALLYWPIDPVFCDTAPKWDSICFYFYIQCTSWKSQSFHSFHSRAFCVLFLPTFAYWGNWCAFHLNFALFSKVATNQKRPSSRHTCLLVFTPTD